MLEVTAPVATMMPMARPGRRLTLGLLYAVIAALASAGLIGLAGWFIVRCAQTGLSSTSGFSWLYPSAGVEALALTRTAARYGERVSTHRSTLDLLARVRGRVFASATRLPIGRLRALRSGDLLDRIQADVDTLDRAVLAVAVPGVVCTAVAAGGLTVLAIVRPFFAVAAGLMLLLVLAVDLILSRGSRLLAQRLAQERSQARARLVEALDGRAELASFGASQLAADELRHRFDALDTPRKRLTAREGAGEAITAVGASVTLAAILASGAGVVGHGLDPAILALAVLLAAALFEAARGLGSAGQALAQARTAWQRLREVTGFGRRDWTDEDQPAGGAGVGGGANVDVDADQSLGAEVELTDVSARYGGSPVLEIPRLEIPPGAFAVLTGPSGAGKSTLLAVMAGEFPGGRGRVRIGGLDPSAISYAQRVAEVTLIEQDASILTGTVADNLRLARPNATLAELQDALRVAALDTSIQLSTEVGPAGDYLSGGQRRRLTVAQGYLRHPRLLLLDEPTEGLDTATALRVLANLRAALPKTTIVAAIHDRNQANLSASVEQVIRLNDGRLS
ncbi:MAG: thiol reductant exporter subunit CydC [Frankiales bacterium]|nr:thiol reductant exporter subunit CydC [Frankiales bacterium]